MPDASRQAAMFELVRKYGLGFMERFQLKSLLASGETIREGEEEEYLDLFIRSRLRRWLANTETPTDIWARILQHLEKDAPPLLDCEELQNVPR